MTSEQVRELHCRIEKAKGAEQVVALRNLERDRHVVADKEIRRYELAPGYEVIVNPVDDLVYASWLSSHLRVPETDPNTTAGSRVAPSRVLRRLALVVAVYEDWKSGVLSTMPPSGTWESVAERLGIPL